MTAVSDTSPLSYLILVGCVDLLRDLFGRVVIPDGVREELGDARAPEAIRAWIASPPAWLEVRPAPTASDPLLDRLHRGEREAILLAEAEAAEIILLDERLARRVAVERGLRVTGVLGALVAGSDRGLIELAVALQRLRKTNFRVAPSLMKSLLERGRP